MASTSDSVAKRECVDCAKHSSEVTVKLSCGKHFICAAKCLGKRALEQPNDILRCSVSHESQGVMIFVDNSNLWIEAKKFQSKKRGFKRSDDPRVRIEYGKLSEVVANDRPKIRATLYGSEPPPNDSVWEMVKNKGFKVHVEERSLYTGKEKRVDTQLVADVTEACFISPDIKDSEKVTIILVMGDADVIPAIDKVLENTRWTVEVYMWDHAMSSTLRSFANKDEYKNRVQIKPLDQRFEDITFVEWKFNKSDFDHRRSVTSCGVVFTMAFTNHNHDPTPDWIREVEDIAKWPCQYYWYDSHKDPQRETNHLVLVFHPVPDPKTGHDFEFDIAHFLKRVEMGGGSQSEYKCKIPSVSCKPQAFLQFVQKGSEDKKEGGVQGNKKIEIRTAEAKNESVSDSSDDSPNETRFQAVAKPRREKMQRFSKTCKYSYHCRMGTQCSYHHPDSEREYFKRNGGKGNPYRKTNLCTRFTERKCRRSKEQCEYAHGADDGWCLNCLTEGHFTKNCPKPKRN